MKESENKPSVSRVHLNDGLGDFLNKEKNLKDKLIAAGVKNLKAFGYPHCNKDNILTDEVYRAFFASMLEDNKGNGKDIDAAIDELLEIVSPNIDVRGRPINESSTEKLT